MPKPQYLELKQQLLHTYCDMGWRILPTWWVHDENNIRCACQLGSECRKPGKHPRISNWETRASCDKNDIDQWHDTWPLANWGWLQDKTFAIDVDKQRGGINTLDEWIEFDGGPLQTLTQGTPNGGLHLIYRQPDDLVPQVGDIMTGIEVRGVGSYIMIEPSVGVTGAWSFRDAGWGLDRISEALTAKIQDCDDQTLALIRRNQSGVVVRGADGGRREDRSRISDLPPTHEFFKRGFGFHTGSRNVDAYRLMWRFLAEADRDTWITDSEIQTKMRIVWRATPTGEHPFPWAEVISIMNSARTRRAKQAEEQRQELLSQMRIARNIISSTEGTKTRDTTSL